MRSMHSRFYSDFITYCVNECKRYKELLHTSKRNVFIAYHNLCDYIPHLNNEGISLYDPRYCDKSLPYKASLPDNIKRLILQYNSNIRIQHNSIIEYERYYKMQHISEPIYNRLVGVINHIATIEVLKGKSVYLPNGMGNMAILVSRLKKPLISFAKTAELRKIVTKEGLNLPTTVYHEVGDVYHKWRWNRIKTNSTIRYSFKPYRSSHSVSSILHMSVDDIINSKKIGLITKLLAIVNIDPSYTKIFNPHI